MELDENKKQIIKEYFRELAKRGVETRKRKYGAGGFREFMKKIGEKGRKTRYG